MGEALQGAGETGFDVPERVGPYRIVRTIGQGGMGIVYEARDERLGRRVALKMLLPGSQDRVSRERLRREARTAATVRHANICEVYDVGDGTELYVAMELLEGEPLSSRIARGALPVTEALRIGTQILAALEVLHARGVLHRDLKPSNVFLTHTGVKLLDFGLALPLSELDDGGERLTLTGTVLGTPPYMAPERWTDDRNIGPESDLFAVGALLFEMVTGRIAYGGKTPLEIVRSLAEPPPSLQGGTDVEPLDLVIRTALAKAPRDRYPSAQAMSLALSQASESIRADTVATASRSVTRVLVLPFRLLRPDPEIDFLSVGIPDAVTTALSGIPSLMMRSPTVGVKFDGAAPDIARIAREVGVDVVLVGTLLRGGTRLRVNAQLLEAPAGTVLWSDVVDATMGDVLALQDELVRRIVESLSIQLSARDRSGMHRKMPATESANDLYLRANQAAAVTGLLVDARDLYARCLEEDPRFAPAWARLGRVHRVLAKYGLADPEESLERAEACFEKSLSLDPELSLAHYLYTHYEVEEGARASEAMVRLLDRVRARPAESDLFVALVLACRFCGLLDASVAAHARARRLEPGVRTSVAFTHWFRGDFAEAIALDDDPMRWIRLYCLPLLGREAEALTIATDLEGRVPAGSRPMVTTTRAAIALDRDGCVAASDSILARGLRDPESLYVVARNLARVGETDRAAAVLKRVVAGGFHVPVAFRRDPWLDGLRGHAGYAAAVREAEAGREAAVAAYRKASGEALLGPAR